MIEGLVKGWCPGALRPMESGDGLIVRLKLTGGIVPLELARSIAGWSDRWGNGQIDLTSHGNLQIRGVTAETLQPLQDAMASAGLLDISPEAEAVRNVIASPLAGLDSTAVLDIRPVVTALEARLVSDKRLHMLPPKFTWLVDDGGALSLDGVRADMRFQAVMTEVGPAFVVRLDGAEEQAFGPCNIAEVDEVAASLGLAFLANSRKCRRMRDLVGDVGAEDLTRAAGLRSLARSTGEGGAKRRVRVHGDSMHPHPPSLRLGPSLSCVAGEGFSVLPVGLSFGRIAADDFQLLASEASHCGASELRLTPWRVLLIPLPTEKCGQRLAEGLSSESFILDPADPRLRVEACVGAPACPRASTSVRADAEALAALVPPGAMLHISGCAKGCAYPRPVSVTLVGMDGAYDLVLDGRPGDVPSRTGVEIAEIAGMLPQIMTKTRAA